MNDDGSRLTPMPNMVKQTQCVESLRGLIAI